MSKIIDFFTKKPIEENETSYKLRKQNCINTTLQYGKCFCEFCTENDKLANKLAEISKWLISDYSHKSKKRIYYGDWLEVVFLAALKVEQHIKNMDNKK